MSNMYILTGKAERFDPLTGCVYTEYENHIVLAENLGKAHEKIRQSKIFSRLREKKCSHFAIVC